MDRSVTIRLKRAYDEPAASDGRRILVDRIWPRGLKREDARIDRWLKGVSPTSALRKWFGHDPARWDEFRRRYFEELDENESGVAELLAEVAAGTVTFVYSTRDTEHNNAVALKEYVEFRLGRS